MISISHVEHELISADVQAATEALINDRNSMMLSTLPDNSGTMTPGMMRSVMRSLSPLMVGVGAAPLAEGDKLTVMDPAGAIFGDFHGYFPERAWTTKKMATKATYSRKRRQAKMRKNRK